VVKHEFGQILSSIATLIRNPIRQSTHCYCGWYKRLVAEFQSHPLLLKVTWLSCKMSLPSRQMPPIVVCWHAWPLSVSN